MRVLITGANGQVGFSLIEAATKINMNFLALTRQQLNISNFAEVRQVVDAYRPDIIINCAAYTAVDRAESEVAQAYDVNATGPENLAKAANAVGAVIFHISTDYVFAGHSSETYSEGDQTDPKSVYGYSKLKGEQAVIAENSKHIILRTAWVFAEHGNNFVKTMIRLGRDRDQLGIVGDQVGGPTYAGDIASALLEMAQQYEYNKNLPWGIYNFSGFPYVSWFEFAKDIFDEVKWQGIYPKDIPLLKTITTADYPTPAKRPANSRLNCDKIQKNFNINMSDWKAALKNIKAYA